MGYLHKRGQQVGYEIDFSKNLPTPVVSSERVFQALLAVAFDLYAVVVIMRDWV